MIVYAECEFFIPAAHSLKEKRAVLQSMITRTKQRYNVSVAEIDHQDVWQRALLAIVTVASSKDAADRELTRALSFLETNPDWECLNIQREYL
ncbi:DUF503 domain-containing protein [Viridibacillus sp. YIM B01967]|uniref:DUF503 domain-containing protein n=1 Tax=Viridibacillus soli TaxID=2798301 RepID=A0ABS1H4Y0_9BACL|nr:DUF503 domain-containing protein [Viridibacillus soli]MBK3494346.1 DUF503 domain-containing protein [Viridibacillus soli]